MPMRLAMVLPVLGASVLVGRRVWNGAELTGFWLVFVVVLPIGWLLRQRDRNRPMRWRPTVRMPDGTTAAGLVAPLSRVEAAWWLITHACFVVYVGGAAGWIAQGGRWPGLLLGALVAAMALWLSHRLYADLPQLRRIVITEAGVLWQGQLIRWAEIKSVRMTTPADDDEEGDVELRLTGRSRRDRPILRGLTPPGSMIGPAELRLAVLTYLRAPERRAELRSPVDPRGDLVVPPDPRLGRHPRRETVEGGAEA